MVEISRDFHECTGRFITAAELMMSHAASTGTTGELQPFKWKVFLTFLKALMSFKVNMADILQGSIRSSKTVVESSNENFYDNFEH